MSNSAAISASGRPYPAADSNSRAPSRWTAAPRSRGPFGLRPQVVPVRLLPAEVALRQLDQQRPGWFGDRGQVVDGQQPVLVAGRAAGQAVQPLEGPVLVPVQVAQRVVHHRPALATVGVHAQHRLLGHRAAGQVDGGRLAEQPGDLGLELGDHAPVAVAVRHRVRGDAGQQVGRAHRAMAGQEHGALVAQGGLLAEVGHAPIIGWAGPAGLRYGPAMEDADGYFGERVAATYDDSSEGMFDPGRHGHGGRGAGRAGAAAGGRWSWASGPAGSRCRWPAAASRCTASTCPGPWWPGCAPSPAATPSRSPSATSPPPRWTARSPWRTWSSTRS